LRDPSSYHLQTKMPNLRISDQEAADIAEFLIQDHNKLFEMKSVPAFDEDIVNEIVLDFMSKLEPTKSAEAKMKTMTLDEKFHFAGQKLIGQYGCYACHDIKGFEDAKPIGPELTEEGSKSLHKFDFGFIHGEHTKHAWFDQKIKDPRSFDQGKLKDPLDKLIMPTFALSKEERDAVVTAILGFVNDITVRNKIMPRTPENLAIEEGQKIVRQLNCQGCHMIEGEGQAIAPSIKEYMVKFESRTQADADAFITAFAPPNLHGEGKKVNPQWLFEFLHKPSPIRPWLKVRMPTYSFNASHLNILLKYFSALDSEEFPFHDQADTTMSESEYKLAEKLFSAEYLGCTSCHIVGDQMPTSPQDSWAPDLSLAKTRLKPEWIIEWIKNPPALLPNTKMPTFFDPNNFDASGPEDVLNGDENEQIRYLRNFLMNFKPSNGNEAPQASTPDDATPIEKAAP